MFVNVYTYNLCVRVCVKVSMAVMPDTQDIISMNQITQQIAQHLILVD